MTQGSSYPLLPLTLASDLVSSGNIGAPDERSPDPYRGLALCGIEVFGLDAFPGPRHWDRRPWQL